MLDSLTVQNIVLIDNVELSFTKGLCVLTGETGAGKSILLDALDTLFAGSHVSSAVRLLRDKSERKRSLHTVINQYLSTTRPMYIEWVLPSRRFADVVLSAENSVSEMKQTVLSQIQATSKTRN